MGRYYEDSEIFDIKFWRAFAVIATFGLFTMVIIDGCHLAEPTASSKLNALELPIKTNQELREALWAAYRVGFRDGEVCGRVGWDDCYNIERRYFERLMDSVKE